MKSQNHYPQRRCFSCFFPLLSVWPLVIMLAFSGLHTGCGGSNGDSIPGTSVRDMQRGIEPGEFELEFKGQVKTVGPAQAEREPAEYFPQNVTQSRERNDGMGGREAVDTSNATGPYRLQLWQEIQRGDQEPETGRIWIQLPPDASAGNSYALYDSRRAGKGHAYGGVVGAGHGWSLNRGLEGWIRVGEIGDHLTVAFHLHNSAEPNQENRLDVTGRVNRLPFQPRAEAKFTITAGGEMTEGVSGTMRQDRPANYLIIVPNYFSIEFDGPPLPGTYKIGTRRGPGTVGLTLDDHRMEGVEGNIEVRQDDTELHLTYIATVTTRSGETVTLNGTLEHVPLSAH